MDLVITNALILDWWGIIKADIGIKDGRICKIGKAGNPYIQDNIDIIIGRPRCQHPPYQQAQYEVK